MNVELVAQMFKNYQSNVRFHLEGTAGLASAMSDVSWLMFRASDRISEGSSVTWALCSLDLYYDSDSPGPGPALAPAPALGSLTQVNHRTARGNEDESHDSARLAVTVTATVTATSIPEDARGSSVHRATFAVLNAEEIKSIT